MILLLIPPLLLHAEIWVWLIHLLIDLHILFVLCPPVLSLGHCCSLCSSRCRVVCCRWACSVVSRSGADKSCVQGGRTPCYIAAQNGHVEPLRALLETKADPNQAKKVRPAPRVGWSCVLLCCLSLRVFCRLLLLLNTTTCVPLPHSNSRNRSGFRCHATATNCD